MQVKVLFFATLRERAGLRQTTLEVVDGSTVAELKDRLLVEYPGLQPSMPTTLVAVNKNFAFDQDVLPAGCEVALFPPVSGGSTVEYIAVATDALDMNDVLARITLPSTGAACIFSGMVRAVTSRGDPHDTAYLEYEAYIPMAEAKLRQVAQEIRQKWPTVEGIALIQRIGRLEPGTPTVVAACSAAHRDTGVFEAARYGIDRLKEIVPVWKKEFGPAGEAWVEGEYIPDRQD